MLRRAFYPVVSGLWASDVIAPTVTITSAATSPTIDSPVVQTITFSEIVTGFNVGDITISAGGSLESFSTLDNKVFTVSWILAPGANTMDIAAGVCTDAAGNENTAATQFAMTYGISPAITPTLGSELVTNGTFDSATTGWSATNSSLASVAGGASGNALEVTNTAAFGDARQTLPALTIGAYYQFSSWAKGNAPFSGNGLVRWGINPAGQDYSSLTYAGAGATNTFIARVTSATSNLTLITNSGTIGIKSGHDNVSVKLITDTGVLLGDIARKNGTYICHPTVAVYSHCGMDVNWLDANNLVRVVVARLSGGDTAKLLKRISGTWTEVITGSITYSAAAELKVVVSGTSFSLYYNGTQVGSTQTIDNSTLGTSVYGFNTLAGNTLGTVTTNP